MMTASEAAERSDLMARLGKQLDPSTVARYARTPLPALRRAVEGCEAQEEFYADNFVYLGGAPAK